ncbi:response regulator [Ligilactobacillus acidipiscis DSM 15836]|uniref:Response regulator n=1 Tax=Ligilactobacillus acidipiscis DSM 15836 TaxID=1423716 RepID=A0ABR5PJY4_9LACO|nr:response regulator transcription factor [Ligilactobacillus acidipiscis]KRM25573.1 response regulator [Ligilactobacillus acidipiscis DSM 15836]GAW64408.1 two-component system response regulator [Ligilactobacillus acidipiscis]GEN21649.1 DNA-binding response regulator [Ligilactobacillus acidipiscis]
MNTLKVLIVEDDESLAKGIQRFLNESVETVIATDGLEGQMLGEEKIFDLVILDLMLPTVGGYDILKKWRTEDKLDMPVLVLTAKDTLPDKLQGFQLGADDYLTKPFHREELLMRIKALLKMAGRIGSDNVLKVSFFEADTSKRTVLVKGQPVNLVGREYDLLVYLLQNPETILTKEQIFDRIWGFDSETALSVVEVYISNLRKKIELIAGTQPIKTLRNVGYMFELEGE